MKAEMAEDKAAQQGGKTAIITGATGMIGSLILEHCLQESDIKMVTSLVRRPSNTQHEKLHEVIVDDFLNLDENAPYFDGVDVVFYCLGVYTGAVDRQTFREITVDYPVKLADVLVNKNPDLTFCLLSGAGADRSEKSRMMFAQDKGIVENRLSAMGFSFYALRPSYIYPVTPRNEPNLGYKISRLMYPLIKLLGPNTSITSTELAYGMYYVGLNGSSKEVLENKDILEISRTT